MLPRALVLGLCLACAGRAVSETPPLQVTTDTSAYCLSLAAQIEGMGPLSAEVARLEREGSRMCRDGMVQGGLHRLRRAMAVMREQQTP